MNLHKSSPFHLERLIKYREILVGKEKEEIKKKGREREGVNRVPWSKGAAGVLPRSFHKERRIFKREKERKCLTFTLKSVALVQTTRAYCGELSMRWAQNRGSKQAVRSSSSAPSMAVDATEMRRRGGAVAMDFLPEAKSYNGEHLRPVTERKDDCQKKMR